MEKTTDYSLSETPFKDIMKEKNYYPNTLDFSNKDILIPSKHIFSNIFPNFFNFIQKSDKEFAQYLTNTKNDSHNKLDLNARAFMRTAVTQYEEEIAAFIGKDWANLRKNTKVHTGLFYALATISMPTHFNEYDQNILYWTILFHDIGKHQALNPNFTESFDIGFDKLHPFKSVYIFLKTFWHNNYIFFTAETLDDEIKAKEKEIFLLKYAEFNTSLFKSYSKKFNGKHTTYNLSFDYIDQFESFLLFLKEKPENKWIYDITVLILFHQSLPNNDESMNKPLLDDKYIKVFFDLRLIELMRFIMVYDSSSHSLFKGGIWVKEINKHMDKTRLLFK